MRAMPQLGSGAAPMSAQVRCGRSASAGSRRRPSVSGPRLRRLIGAALAVALLTVAPVAHADPAPPPDPPSPATNATAAQVGALVGQLSDFQATLDRAMAAAGRREELANRAVADDDAAREHADGARREAVAARERASAAAAAVDQAHQRVDQWATAWFQQADMTSPVAVLSGASGPDEILDRATLRAAVTDDQRTAIDALEQAQAAATAAETRARTSQAGADRAAATAATARRGAETELDRARAGVEVQLRSVRDVVARRDAAEAKLAALEASDAAVAASRRRAEAMAAEAAGQVSASDSAERSGARARLAGPAGSPVRAVLDRALSQLGTVYAWGGGNAAGPTQGIRDGGVADAFGDFGKVGFDCSGLMIYAFAAAGVALPHYSGYQATAGPQFPLAQRRPGDLLFWADGADVHHVALYLGDDRMVEAPQSGKVVRVTPVRFGDGIVPTVTRLLR